MTRAMRPARVGAIAAKEWLHIIHDPRSLVILLLMPVFQLVIFGYAMNMEIREVRLGVYDLDHSTYSRTVLRAFEGSETFTLSYPTGTPQDLHDHFARQQLDAALIVPLGAEADARRGRPVALQLVVDASDPNKATLVRTYAEQLVVRQGAATVSLIDARQQVLFNPDLDSSFFFVPGLVAFILVMICALLTSITITREKENGTLEQLAVTPALPIEIILGKLLPYIGLSLLIGALILLLGIALFGVAFEGSALLLVGLSLLYVVAALSLGVMISTFAATQQVAMMMAILLTMLPTIMLSGFIFPLGSMPAPLQWISHLAPARYFLVIVRGVMLKGNGLAQLHKPVLALVAFTVLLLTVAVRRFKRENR